jgi:hypothetical protein
LFGIRQSIWFKVALAAGVFQAIAALALKEGYVLAVIGDTVPLVFSCLVIVLCYQNSRAAAGSPRMFWHLNVAAFTLLLLSHAYWFYSEVVRPESVVNPILGDGLFFLMPALMLAALAFRPHSDSAASDLRLRRLELAFLLFWWLCFYLYFVVPWLTVANDFSSYNRANYSLVLVEQSAVVFVLLVLWKRTTGTWRRFYGHGGLAVLIYALANFVQGIAMAAGKYYSGSIYDVPLGVGGVWIVYAYTIGSNLQSTSEPSGANSERRGLWTARLAMAAMISLPLLGIYGFLESASPAAVLAFRLRLILGAMLLLGSLCFLKLSILDRELQRLISVTEASYESLKTVQERIAHSEKLAALGRLASGATHEINNPLTAIYGYSELLTDNPALSREERCHAKVIQEQVRLAQSAVFSMRGSASPSQVAKPNSADEPSSH